MIPLVELTFILPPKAAFKSVLKCSLWELSIIQEVRKAGSIWGLRFSCSHYRLLILSYRFDTFYNGAVRVQLFFFLNFKKEKVLVGSKKKSFKPGIRKRDFH